MFLTIIRKFHTTPPISKPRKRFVDSIRVWVQGGAGGQGLKKLTGVGGKGGDVYLVGSKKATLKKLLEGGTSYKAAAGSDASRKRVLGDPGKDLIVPVPIGVSFCDARGNVVGEINREDQSVLVATGATGGGPWSEYVGYRAEKRHLSVDLKLLADVGLVGFPNAGKSTLLSRLSRATPKIAAYPFTTLQPQIGAVEYEDLKQISIADLPGLVEGAHVNIGLGHQFLRHVERTKLLIFVIDVDGFRLSDKYPQFRSPMETTLLLMRELESYNEDLVHRPAILCVNKVDDAEKATRVEKVLEEFKRIEELAKDSDPVIVPEKLMKFEKIHVISARENINIDPVISDIRTIYDEVIRKEIEAENNNWKLEDFTFHLKEKRGVDVV